MASAAGLRDHFRCTDRRGARRRGEWRGFGTEAARRDNCRDPAGAAHPPRDFLWGNPAVRFPFAPGEGRAHFQLGRPDPPRWHATPPQGAMVDLGANGRQSGRQRPIGEVDRANQNPFAPSRQMPLVYPWRWLCVRSVLPGQVFLAALVATDIRERLRGVCPRLLCKDRRRLAQCSPPVRPYFPICTMPNIILTQAHQAGSAPP